VNGAAQHPIGEAAPPAFPSFPQFLSVPVPEDVTLTSRVDGKPVTTRVHPTAAWQGVVRPFESDTEARRVLRLLSLDRAVDVWGGQLIAPAGVNRIPPHSEEDRLTGCDVAFDLLVLEFQPPWHPWVFSLSPPISRHEFPDHPHMRSDRTIRLGSRTLEGFCMYSAAEFKFGRTEPQVPQILRQAAIFLAKHIVWRKTQRLVNRQTGQTIHDGIGLSPDYVHPDSVWQVKPIARWVGLWPGKSALSGAEHLKLDPEGECWCGKGNKYKNCCRPEEQKLYG
jgi:hypothetical protein